MIDTIYVENAVACHDRTKTMTGRFPDATCVTCDRYQEVFNPKAQNFRLQKKKAGPDTGKEVRGNCPAGAGGLWHRW